MAGLVAQDCQPGAHSAICKNRDSKSWLRCNTGYVTYPKRMMWWRAAGFCADDWFPTASMGLYSPEALGAVVDEEGRPIDPSTVRLPDGYEPEPPPPPAPAEMVTVAERDDLRRRLRSLPEAAQPVAATAWKIGLDGSFDDPNSAYLQPLGKEGEDPKLPKRTLAKARALVAHFEERAKGGEWGDWTPPPAPPADPKPAGDDSSSGAAADKDPAPAAPADPPAGDGAGDPPLPPVTAPAAPVAPPTPPEAHTASQSAADGVPEPCPACHGTGIVGQGEACPFCTPTAACNYCRSDSHPRHELDVDMVRCIDQDACWEREQALDPAMAAIAANAEPLDVASRELPAQRSTAADDPAVEPSECPLCHSARSVLTFVPHGHGQEGGLWRCQNASACRERAKGKTGVDVARAALAEHAPPPAK